MPNKIERRTFLGLFGAAFSLPWLPWKKKADGITIPKAGVYQVNTVEPDIEPVTYYHWAFDEFKPQFKGYVWFYYTDDKLIKTKVIHPPNRKIEA